MTSVPTRTAPRQADLFGFADVPPAAPVLPEGLVYQPDFLSPEEEAGWLDVVRGLPLAEAQYKEYTARRRVVSYGGSFDYDSNRLLSAQPLPGILFALRDRVAAWLGVAPDRLVHALVAEYRPGTPLGWHRDVPDFEAIAGISLGTAATLRFRPYPPHAPRRQDILRLEVQPRSIYRMEGAARWAWQHSVPPTPGLRWSITFRTARHGG